MGEYPLPHGSMDNIQNCFKAIFDEFVYNCLPRHLLHVKTKGNNSEDVELDIISGA